VQWVFGYGATTLIPRYRSPNITFLSLDQGSTIVCALRWFPIPPLFHLPQKPPRFPKNEPMSSGLDKEHGTRIQSSTQVVGDTGRRWTLV